MARRALQGTSVDYFLASRGIGSFFLLMSLFGTTMTAFALVGSTGEAFRSGIGVYGLMGSSSGIVHSACFFFIGLRVWDLGKRHGYVTQIQLLRDRFEAPRIGIVVFPLLVLLVVPYLLIGVLGAGSVIRNVTVGALPGLFPATDGGVPAAAGSGAVCAVVLVYVFFGGVRGTAWANAFQTTVFILLGVVAFAIIAQALGGPVEATRKVLEDNPSRLKRSVTKEDTSAYQARLAQWETEAAASKDGTASFRRPEAPREIPPLEFLTYLLIPLSVGMFPHIFQHWLTARTARTFRLAIVAHPLLILLVWVPCILVGVWGTSAMTEAGPVIPDGLDNANGVLAIMVQKLTTPVLSGLLAAGILAAIMSSLDSQFLCVGTMFTHDVVVPLLGGRLSDRAKVVTGRTFVCIVVLVTYLISLLEPREVFSLGVWCFSGFTGLFPLIIAALYWKRATSKGAWACALTAAATLILLYRDAGWGSDHAYVFLGMVPAATVFLFATTALVLVSLVTRPVSEATLRKFSTR
jgi:SSS family solute:Na+ symporter